MKKENIMETLLSIGMFVIILVWFLIVYKLFSSMDTIREQCSTNMNNITNISVTYDAKVAELKTIINKQQATIDHLQERIESLEIDNNKLTKKLDMITTTEEEILNENHMY